MEWFIIKFFMIKAPTALSISYNIYARIFSYKNILKCKIQSVNYSRSPKDVRILTLHNITHSLSCRSVISYDLDDISSFNFFNSIFKLLRNVMSIFHFSIGIYGVQEHRIAFDDRHEINERSLLRIRSSITTNGDPFCFHVALMDSSTPLREISDVAREWFSKSCSREVCNWCLNYLLQI